MEHNEWPEYLADEAEAVAENMEADAQREDRRERAIAAEGRREERARWYNSPEQVAIRATRRVENEVKQAQAHRVQQAVCDALCAGGGSHKDKIMRVHEWGSAPERTEFEKQLVDEYVARELKNLRVMYGEDA